MVSNKRAQWFHRGYTVQNPMKTEQELAALCCALLGPGAKLSGPERILWEPNSLGLFDRCDQKVIRSAIQEGQDPLGEAFARIRSPQARRAAGAVYTPPSIVRAMVAWMEGAAMPSRIVDPGAGSGRFIIEAAKRFPKAQLIAVELDPLAALMLRANLQVLGLADRSTVIVDDYRSCVLPQIQGVTAFIGNPPYVRHHDVGAAWKTWYATRFADLGIVASGLAGLHLHFFLQTCLLGRTGDIGAFVTSAEWLDVNYGRALRQLFLQQLGGVGLHVLDARLEPFPGTATTAAITCFKLAQRPIAVRVHAVASVDKLDRLQTGFEVSRDVLAVAPRWSVIVRPSGAPKADTIELGELCRVHRGQVTGANSIWIAGKQASMLPLRLQLPTVTKARDLIDAGMQLCSQDKLRRVVDLPPDLDELNADERIAVDVFMAWAKSQGADKGYVARHRKAWWAVGLKPPAPILCTYMARRPPQFTLNGCDARHINIAHGLYPRAAMSAEQLAQVVHWLNHNISTSDGRTYAGGLTKFEPREIERLRIPSLEILAG